MMIITACAREAGGPPRSPGRAAWQRHRNADETQTQRMCADRDTAARLWHAVCVTLHAFNGTNC